MDLDESFATVSWRKTFIIPKKMIAKTCQVFQSVRKLKSYWESRIKVKMRQLLWFFDIVEKETPAFNDWFMGMYCCFVRLLIPSFIKITVAYYCIAPKICHWATVAGRQQNVALIFLFCSSSSPSFFSSSMQIQRKPWLCIAKLEGHWISITCNTTEERLVE